MVDFTSAENEADFIDEVRAIFRAYVPESDAYAKPNTFDVFATVTGGLAWSAVNEARNGFDARANPQTVTGEALDILASMPPLSMSRIGETQSVGFVTVDIPALATVLAGYEFTTAAGIVFTADVDTALTAGVGTVAVTSASTGSTQNSISGQPLEIVDTGTASSLGIYGGNDIESDDQLRQRMFAERASFHFFGSACSYETAMLGFPDVTRAWAFIDGLTPKIAFLMEDKYPCGGEPLDSDIAAVQAYFADDCRTNLAYCPTFAAAEALAISPLIAWDEVPSDISEVRDALDGWLRENYIINEAVEVCDIKAFLNLTFPEYGPSIDCCDDYPAVCGAVYNHADIIDCNN